MTSYRNKTKGDKASALLRKVVSTNIVGLIDAAFRQKVTVVESGRRKRVTNFDAIYKKLWALEMAGDRRASAVRMAYEKFANEQSPKRKRPTILIGGLPE